ncbi:MAG: YqaE/Pmp3 family membrane protein [Chitinophagales bacterium]
MKHSLLLVAVVVLCCQFFSSCSSSKMTQAEVAEYYKDLKITGQGTGSYVAKTERIVPTSTATMKAEISSQTIIEENIEVSENLSVLSETPIMTASNEEVILAVDTPTFNSSTATEQPVAMSSAMEDAQQKMEILASNSTLSKKEKRTMKKEVRQTLMKEIKIQKKAMKEAKKDGQEVAASDNQILRLVLAFFLPPASVAIGRGIGSTFWLNLVLTLLFVLPGIIHALIVYGEDY